MDINGVSALGPSAQRLNLVEQAQQVASDRQLSTIVNKQIAVGKESPTVTTSQSFSPALYAQAAQFQIYTQSGALSALLGSQGSHTAAAQPNVSSETKIEAVDSAQGSRLDTLA